MARPLRIEYPGACYHVTARGNERKRIYFNKTDYVKFRKYIENAQEKYGCLLHVYVFMTNHYHMILETPQANISKVMHFINGSYTNYINKKRDRSGHLFQGRFKAPKMYKQFVENGMGGDLENPFLKIYGGSILGETSFIKQALNKLKEGVLSRKETSHRKMLESAFKSDVIVNAVSKYFGIDKEVVLKDRREYRNICIYIMKKYTGMTNSQIGQIFDGLSFSAVSKAFQREAKAINENRAMRKKANKIITTLSQFKG
ncbi:transposase [Thermodesulfobacteriota bacterium]